MNFSDYKKWAGQQSCIDCGKKASDRKRGMNGCVVDEDTWVTETQCVKCWSKFGAPEHRGLKSTAEIFEQWEKRRNKI